MLKKMMFFCFRVILTLTGYKLHKRYFSWRNSWSWASSRINCSRTPSPSRRINHSSYLSNSISPRIRLFLTLKQTPYIHFWLCELTKFKISYFFYVFNLGKPPDFSLFFSVYFQLKFSFLFKREMWGGDQWELADL